MSLLSALEFLRDAKRQIESEKYALQNERYALSWIVEQELLALHNNTTIADFSDFLLIADGARYLVVELGTPYAHDRKVRKMLTLVEIRVNGVDIAAFDVDTDERIGAVNQWTFHPSTSEPDWMRYSNNGPNRAWRVHHLCERLLTVSGPAVSRHPFAQKLSLHAQNLMDGHPAMARMRPIDFRLTGLMAEYETIDLNANALPRAFLGDRLDVLMKNNAELAAMIRSMDMDYDYADRISDRSRCQAFSIGAQLDALPLDDALALFVANEPIYWTYAMRYTLNHPQRPQQQKAA